MMRRGAAILFAAGLLGGCSDADWDHALSYAGFGTDQPVATADAAPAESAAPQPAAVSAPSEEQWCAEVGKAAQREAAELGFDAATQRRRAQSVFQQCAHNPDAQPR